MAFSPPTASFPTSILTDESIGLQANRAQNSLAGTITPTTTVIPLDEDISGIPSAGICTIEGERILFAATDIANRLLLVAPGGRGWDGSVQASHVAGITVKFNDVAWHHNKLVKELEAVQEDLGTESARNYLRTDGSVISVGLQHFSAGIRVAEITNGTGVLTLPLNHSDTLVGRSTEDTLTNKTLTLPQIASILNVGVLTLPTTTDVLVGRDTTDEMTNKVLDDDSNNIRANSLATNADPVIVDTAGNPTPGFALIADTPFSASWSAIPQTFIAKNAAGTTLGIATTLKVGSGLVPAWDNTNKILTITATGVTPGTTISVQEDGGTVTSGIATLNFTGSGVNTSYAGSVATITISGGGGGGGSVDNPMSADLDLASFDLLNADYISGTPTITAADAWIRMPADDDIDPIEFHVPTGAYHKFTAGTGTRLTISEAIAGFEVPISLKDYGGDPLVTSGFAAIYSKSASGVTQIFARAGNGTVYQLTPPTGGGGGSGFTNPMTVDLDMNTHYINKIVAARFNNTGTSFVDGSASGNDLRGGVSGNPGTDARAIFLNAEGNSTFEVRELGASVRLGHFWIDSANGTDRANGAASPYTGGIRFFNKTADVDTTTSIRAPTTTNYNTGTLLTLPGANVYGALYQKNTDLYFRTGGNGPAYRLTPTTGASPGTYTNTSIVVDANGRISSISTGSGGSGGGNVTNTAGAASIAFRGFIIGNNSSTNFTLSYSGIGFTPTKCFVSIRDANNDVNHYSWSYQNLTSTSVVLNIVHRSGTVIGTNEVGVDLMLTNQ